MATMNSLTDIWSVVMDSLSQELTQTAINTWFSDCTPIEINNNTLIVHTTSDFKRSIIQARFEKTICAKLYDLFSCPFELVVLAGDDELLEYREKYAPRNRSRQITGPWVKNFVEMAKKTIIRRSFKYLPVNIEAKKAASVDETTPDYSDVFQPVITDSTDDVTAEVMDTEADSEQQADAKDGE